MTLSSYSSASSSTTTTTTTTLSLLLSLLLLLSQALPSLGWMSQEEESLMRKRGLTMKVNETMCECVGGVGGKDSLQVKKEPNEKCCCLSNSATIDPIPLIAYTCPKSDLCSPEGYFMGTIPLEQAVCVPPGSVVFDITIKFLLPFGIGISCFILTWKFGESLAALLGLRVAFLGMIGLITVAVVPLPVLGLFNLTQGTRVGHWISYLVTVLISFTTLSIYLAEPEIIMSKFKRASSAKVAEAIAAVAAEVPLSLSFLFAMLWVANAIFSVSALAHFPDWGYFYIPSISLALQSAAYGVLHHTVNSYEEIGDDSVIILGDDEAPTPLDGDSSSD